MVTVDETEEQAWAELLNLDGVFYVFKVDRHGELLFERTDDETVVTEFRRSIGHLAMRVAALRMTFDTCRAPVGSLKSVVLEFDRAALLALPSAEGTVGLALLKEHATPRLIAQAQASLVGINDV